MIVIQFFLAFIRLGYWVVEFSSLDTIVYRDSLYVSSWNCSTSSNVWWWHTGALTFGHHGAFIFTTTSLRRTLVDAWWFYLVLWQGGTLHWSLYCLVPGKGRNLPPGMLTTFLGLVDWATGFAEYSVNWNKALLEGAKTRAHYASMSIIDGGSFPIRTHPVLLNQDF